MTNEEINNMKYKVCCPLCDNDKCVRGIEKCEAEIWAKQKAESEEEEWSEPRTNLAETSQDCISRQEDVE